MICCPFEMLQVFKPDKMNGFDVQTEVDAMLERQRREIMPKMLSTPGPRYRLKRSRQLRKFMWHPYI